MYYDPAGRKNMSRNRNVIKLTPYLLPFLIIDFILCFIFVIFLQPSASCRRCAFDVDKELIVMTWTYLKKSVGREEINVIK